jgi:UV DNA damage endonuclease
MSSDLVPFATHESMNWKWYNDLDVIELCSQIKKIVKENGVRLTSHPAQFTILNALNQKILDNCVKDLEYHDKLMELTGGSDMITHTGGVYGDKESAKKRFIENYKNLLSDSIKQKLRLENDDKSFHVEDVLEIHNACGIPVVLDIHHHKCNPCKNDIKDLMPKIIDSWKNFGTPKMHISTGKKGPTDISHHDYISYEDFSYLLSLIEGYDVDIMLEAKRKEESIFKLREKGLIKPYSKII